MKIDAIDIYWVRIPLAFVWKTSYADQHDTDTILVRMESDGQHAWGESCPPYIPAYSAEHTARHLPHASRAHGPAHRRPGPRVVAGPAGPDRLHQGQRVRPGRPRHRLVGAATRSAGVCRCTRRSAARPIVSPSGADFGIQDSHGHPAREDPGGHRSGLPAHQAEVPAGLGPAHGGRRAIHLPEFHLPHRLQRRLHAGRRRSLPQAGPLPPGHDRAAAGRRRHEPRSTTPISRRRSRRPSAWTRARRAWRTSRPPSGWGAARWSTSRWPAWEG